MNRHQRKTATLLTLTSAASLFGAEPADTNYDEARVPNYSLPALLPNDSPTADPDLRDYWETTRRAEILSLLEENVYGKTPTAAVTLKTEVLEGPTDVFDGLGRRRQIRLTISPKDHPDRSLKIEVLLYSPKSPGKKAPAFLGLNFSGNQCINLDPAIRINPASGKARGFHQDRWQVEWLLKRGYALVTSYCGDIDPDNYRHDFTDGPHPLFYENGQSRPGAKEWGTIGAWAWGLSRIRESLQDDLFIDAKRMAVIGHSRLGKCALWTGAQDENFKMVVSNNSGAGGAALYRRCFGERIHHMLKPVGYWFCRHHASYAHREEELPTDQHMLLAAIAPRALYVASATKDQWADPRGEFLALVQAAPIYSLYGLEGLPASKLPPPNHPVSGARVGYHLREGKHAVTAFDWGHYLDFADRQLAP